MDGQPEAKKQKVNLDDSIHRVIVKDDEKSEDDWEEVDKADGGPEERLDDEPVEVGQASSVVDVQSVQSSGIIDLNESQHSVQSMLDKDW